MASKAAKEPSEKIIPWMTNDVRTSLKYKREANEEFKKPSKQNKKSKTEGPKA